MIISLKENDIIFDERAQGQWCLLPYPNHPKGCPNYGRKVTCPPFSKPYFDLIKPPYYLVIENFDIEAQKKKMRKRHPKWSDKQCRNLLYWQKGVVKRLKEKAKKFINSQNEDFILLEVPEANGVNVFKTCENVDIILDRVPQKIIRKIMIIGTKRS